MEKDKVFTYEPKMRENLELIMDIMRYDCDYVVYKDKKIADLEAKLAESEKNFIIAKNLIKNSNEVLLNYKTEKYGLDKTIQELRKIKLSFPEKEWYYKGFENCERQMSSHIADLTLEVKELKQRLSEKDKEIESLKENWNVLCDYLGECIVKYDEIDTNGIYSEVLEKVNKLKKYDTSIAKTQNQKAIEQLEKVKEYTDDVWWVDGVSEVVCNFIDNQIKQLKGMK